MEQSSQAPSKKEAEHFAAGYTQSLQDMAIIFDSIYKVTLGQEKEIEIDLASGTTVTIRRTIIDTIPRLNS